ncbi:MULTISPECIES: carboxylesterase family protein [unclassified Streptomyces]|uniref:carboxylesterase/lipase family protein n=1 Tax=unclassified Streptomyces TaxID=2593676 RepID=UPI002E800416|nr:carboxylesterase family protein [Streptomyces sp. NBC_00589]WTI33899.1 carboxylesterase family protein [Streptomyces sp. NBC_00775]WUB32428.1 carboxylesterase family protein [Streptomyces sp. NBC_00589]
MRDPVDTESGPVEGILGRDRSVTVFRGIPYAAPPVGELRWRPPRPPLRWEGVRRADRFGPMCPQAPTDAAATGVDVPMSEDCLNLNIWTGAATSAERRPVLVWIYGGGFREGTGAHPRYDGANLARRGLVVITFNYRLGAFGFLATPELSGESGHHACGNYGLLDCVAALRWVRDNIAHFGGDPDRVTIAGQSAGAGTVNFLAMSPLAKGLFHRAVAQSHARYARDPELRYLATSYRLPHDAETAGAAYAREHGARTPRELRALPWRKLVDGHHPVDGAVQTGSTAGPPLFRPVVDGWVIPAGYDETYAKGLQNDVDYLTGNNLDESGAVPEAAVTALRTARRATRPGAPPVHLTLDAHRAAARRKFGALAEEFLRLYPAATDDEAARASSAAVRDNSRISTHLWGAEWTRHTTRPVHTYFWTHRAPVPGSGPRRAAHGCEIDFLFGNPAPGTARWTDEDREIAETVSSYWVNFAATGDPNGAGLPHWPAYSPDAGTVMEIGARCRPIPVADPDRTDFWTRFFRTQQAW